MTPTAGGSGTSSPPDRAPTASSAPHRAAPGPGETAASPDRAVWARVEGVQDTPLDLMTARLKRLHYAPHVHEEFAIGVTTAGCEVMRYRGGTISSGPGDLVVVEPGEPHTGGPAGAEGFAYRVMYPSASFLAEVGRRMPHFRDPIVRDPMLGCELWRAHRALMRGDDPLEGESRLLWTLTALVGRHAETAARPAGPDGGPGGEVARLVAARLADEITAPPALTDLAADLGLSRYQVLRAFRDAMGMPPYAWLAQYRVGRARALLEAGWRPAEAASAVGFADQAHLTRWFRRVLGVTPGVYRNSVQDGARRSRPD
ncbi:helix-turn-helix domain-containing protein [Spirillospora sp. NPDC050679]